MFDDDTCVRRDLQPFTHQRFSAETRQQRVRSLQCSTQAATSLALSGGITIPELPRGLLSLRACKWTLKFAMASGDSVLIRPCTPTAFCNAIRRHLRQAVLRVGTTAAHPQAWLSLLTAHQRISRSRAIMRALCVT